MSAHFHCSLFVLSTTNLGLDASRVDLHKGHGYVKKSGKACVMELDDEDLQELPPRAVGIIAAYKSELCRLKVEKEELEEKYRLACVGWKLEMGKTARAERQVVDSERLFAAALSSMETIQNHSFRLCLNQHEELESLTRCALIF